MPKTNCKFNKEFQEFGGNPQFISAGKISANAVVGNSTTETNLFAQDIPADLLDSASKQFRLTLGGTISSDGTDDVTLTLRYGTTDILALTTVSLPDEDDKAFRLVFEGRIHTTGASGKVVAVGTLKNAMTGMADLINTTAVAGASVTLTTASTLNVSAEWDGQAATSTMTVHTGILEFFN
jgi:hypothetical protein